MDNVTYLEELQDLGPLEDISNGNIIQPSIKQISSKIRNFDKDINKIFSGPGGNYVKEEINIPNKYIDDIKYSRPIFNETIEDYNNHLQDISCINISEHIKICPICSKLYKTDKYYYIAMIIILLIIIVLLSNRLFIYINNSMKNKK